MAMERTLVHVPKEDLEAAEQLAKIELVKRAVIIRKALRAYIVSRQDDLFLANCSQVKTIDAQKKQEASHE